MNIKLQILDLSSDDIKGKFTVTIYGKTDDNKNVVVHVKEFKPFFYVRIPDDWKKNQIKSILENISGKGIKLPADKKDIKINKPDEDYEILVEHGKDFNYHNFNGYMRDDNNITKEKKYKFIKLSFNNYNMMKKTIASIKKYYLECKDKNNKNDGNMKKFVDLNNEDGEFRFDSNLHESNIHPLLRFIHDTDIKASGWIQIDIDKLNIVKDDNKRFNCDTEYDNINYNNIKTYDNNSLSNYVIGSFDIECDSSHGDFPNPIKDFNKLAIYIVDDYLSNAHIYENKSLYDYLCKTIKNSIKYEIKENDTENSIYIENGPYDENSMVKAFLEGNDDGDIKLDNKGYKMKQMFIDFQDCLKSEKRNDGIKKLNNLLKLLENYKKQKLKVKGDPVIQIGTVFYTYGKENSYERYIQVIGPRNNMSDEDICCDLDNITVLRYKSEKELLEGWADLILDKNPDYITGYNIFSFDFEYIMNRVEELYTCHQHCKENKFTKCVNHTYVCPTNRFYRLGRLIIKQYDSGFKDFYEKRCKKVIKRLGGQKDDDKDDNFMQDTLKYIHMDGRIIFDVMNEVKKGYSLDSYKLDNVASNFMRGKVKSVRNVTYEDERYMIFKTDRKGNLKEGDYISFNVKKNYGDMKYNNGVKYCIMDIVDEDDTSITIKTDNKINRNHLLKNNDILYSEWCLNKDDISPQKLFHDHKFGGPNGRGMIAKYCVMDCELCIHLLLMFHNHISF